MHLIWCHRLLWIWLSKCVKNFVGRCVRTRVSLLSVTPGARRKKYGDTFAYDTKIGVNGKENVWASNESVVTSNSIYVLYFIQVANTGNMINWAVPSEATLNHYHPFAYILIWRTKKYQHHIFIFSFNESE